MRAAVAAAGRGAADRAALSEWKAAVERVQRGANEEEAGAALGAAKPKLWAIAAANQDNETGAQALRSLVLWSTDGRGRARLHPDAADSLPHACGDPRDRRA
jgi:hypothetical protein